MAVIADPVHFTMYANYSHYIDRAEVRIFDASESREGAPLAVVALSAGGSGDWQASVGIVRRADARAQVRAARVRQGRDVRRNDSAAAVARVRGRCAAAIAQSAAAARTSELTGHSRRRRAMPRRRSISYSTLRSRTAPTMASPRRARPRRRASRRPKARTPRPRAGVERCAAERRRRVTAARVRREPARPPQHSARERHRDGARQRDSAGPQRLGGGHPVPVDASGNFVARGDPARGRAHGRSRGARRRRQRRALSARPRAQAQRLVLRRHGRRHAVAERHERPDRAAVRATTRRTSSRFVGSTRSSRST